MDEIDDLLTPKADASSISRREAILAQGSTVLRQWRWARRRRQLGTAGMCFAAGALVTWWFGQFTLPDNVVARLPEPPTAVKEDNVALRRSEPPEQIERWASMAASEKRADLYRRAGDLYLERSDQVAALRCYGQAIDTGRPDDLIVRPQQDSWLLMAMKFDRQKEK